MEFLTTMEFHFENTLVLRRR